MKIGILSRNRTLYSTRRLIEAVETRGHDVRVIDTVRAAIQLSLGPELQRNNPHLPPLDAAIPRIGASVTSYGLKAVRYFKEKGVILTANENGIANSRDKWLSHRVLADAGIPVPKTRFVPHPNQLWPAIIAVGGLPVVFKRRQSTQGRGVMLVSRAETVRQIKKAMSRQRRPTSLLVQAYIPESEGRDTRLIVVGDRIVAAMERTATDGDFRSNLHRGGTAIPIIPSPEIEALAFRGAKTLGLQVGGIDIIQSEQGPLLLEANSSPGLEGIEGSTGIDVAGSIVAYLEEQAALNALSEMEDDEEQ